MHALEKYFKSSTIGHHIKTVDMEPVIHPAKKTDKRQANKTNQGYSLLLNLEFFLKWKSTKDENPTMTQMMRTT